MEKIMKVSEIRENTKKYNREQLTEVLVTAYKMLPKQKKEELDPYIIDLYAAMKEKKAASAAPALPSDFHELKQEILEFIDDAQNQYYFAPNRIIPKQKRSRWRFIVKRYLKALFAIPTDDANAEEAGQLLLKLFNLLSQACAEYLFSTQDPFGAVGYEQNALYSKCAEYALKVNAYGEDTLKEVIRAATFSQVNYLSLNLQFEVSLINLLDANERKHAIAVSKVLIQEQLNKRRNDAGRWDMRNFRIDENIQNLTNLIGMLHLTYGDFDGCLDDYWKCTSERDPETALYILMNDVIAAAGDDEMYAAAYENGVKKRKIKPREELTNMYKEVKDKLK